jgi:hypothetical protein
MLKNMEMPMPFWQRLLITIIAMLLASFVAGLAWASTFDAGIPSYLGGIIGGLAALPVWELLKRINIKPRG